MRDAAVIGTDRVHAALILEPGANIEDIVHRANSELADYQRVRSFSVWPYAEFPRTEGTGKLKRHEIAKGTPPPAKPSRIDLSVPLESLTSLERVERMVALGLDESQLAETPEITAEAEAAADFPSWNRGTPARAARRIVLPCFLLPLSAYLRPRASRGPGESRRHPAAGDLRLQPSELHGRARHLVRAPLALALSASRPPCARNSSKHIFMAAALLTV